jgi:hypothetical protein
MPVIGLERLVPFLRYLACQNSIEVPLECCRFHWLVTRVGGRMIGGQYLGLGLDPGGRVSQFHTLASVVALNFVPVATSLSFGPHYRPYYCFAINSQF